VGTTVSIYLPCAKPAAASASAPRRGKTRGGGRVVLLVDDDYFVRAGTAIVLETLGYNVLAAESGTAALKILRHESAVDALVTDYAMAGMNGMNLIAEARRLLPRLPALLMTGYPVKPDGIKASAILFKPFQPQDLERRLADILRNGPPTDAASASSVGSG
jgi:CheY-like chemotaxis protein